MYLQTVLLATLENLLSYQYIIDFKY